MRKIILALAAASTLALAACTGPGGVLSPGTYADKTSADEQAGLTFTLAYTAASRAAALAIKLADAVGHPFSNATIAHIGQLDSQAYAAVMALRSAYQAGNATSIAAAIEGARAAIGALSVASGAKPVSLNTDRANPVAAAAAAHAQLQAGA